MRAVKRYTASIVEWIAAFDATTSRCYYLPASLLGTGMNEITLGLVPPRNGQRKGVRLASDYLEF